MSVFAFNKEKLADLALLDELLCLQKGGGATAYLTDHKSSAGLLFGIDHSLTLLHIKSHRLFAKNVLAGSEECFGHFQMVLVGCNDNRRINLGIVYKFSVIGHRLFNLREALKPLFENVLVLVAYSVKLCAFLRNNSVHVTSCHITASDNYNV